MLELACNNVEQSMLPLLNHSFEEVNERLNEDQIILLVPSPRQNPVFVERIQGNNLVKRLFQIRYFIKSLFSVAFRTTTYLVMMSQNCHKKWVQCANAYECSVFFFFSLLSKFHTLSSTIIHLYKPYFWWLQLNYVMQPRRRNVKLIFMGINYVMQPRSRNVKLIFMGDFA